MKTYITLDYELFMGVSGTPEKCLVAPMNFLTEMLDRYGVKLNIFVDAAYLLRLHELKCEYSQLQRDYDLVISHIQRLDKEGHAIQLHLHPQWLYSEFNGSHWILDYTHYKLSDLTLDEQKKLISSSVSFLNNIINRKVSAFRGGGYCVDSFQELYQTFLDNGIINDTSVLRGEKSHVNYKKYDYRRVPLMSSYPISGDVTKIDDTGRIIEYPISTIVVPSWQYILNKKNQASSFGYSTSKWGDGKGLGYRGSRVSILLNRFEMLLGKKSIRASIDGFGSELEKVYLYSKTHYKGNDFVIIGHPKLVTPLSIRNLESFINNHKDDEFALFK